MQPSLPLFSGDGSAGRPKGKAAGNRAANPATPANPANPANPAKVRDRVDGVEGFLVGDEVRVDGLRGRFRCRAFFLDGTVPTVEVFGPLLDGRAGARVPAVRTFPVDRLRRSRRR